MLSRPITSTTKPSYGAPNTNYQSSSALGMQRVVKQSKALKRSATGGRMRDSKRPWHRHQSNITSLDISSSQ